MGAEWADRLYTYAYMSYLQAHKVYFDWWSPITNWWANSVFFLIGPQIKIYENLYNFGVRGSVIS
jgi:hypothetical protein